jgi:hypothetical protein
MRDNGSPQQGVWGKGYQLLTMQQLKGGVLLSLLLAATPMVLADSYNSARGGAESVSREEWLRYLQQKREKTEARIRLIDQEIRCVEETPEGRSFWGCYEVAQQQRTQLNQRYPGSVSPYARQRNQRGGMMPNFDRMGMGGMRMPW